MCVCVCVYRPNIQKNLSSPYLKWILSSVSNKVHCVLSEEHQATIYKDRSKTSNMYLKFNC